MNWEMHRRDHDIRLRAKEMGCCDALDGFPEDWIPFTFVPEVARDPYTLNLVYEGYAEGYAEGSKPLPF